MIDTDKYEGHTEGPWYLIGAKQIVYDKDNNPIAQVEYFAQEHHSYYNKALITDAPLLLAEVKKLRHELEIKKEALAKSQSSYKQLRRTYRREVKKLRHELEIKKEALAKSQSSYKQLRKELKELIE